LRLNNPTQLDQLQRCALPVAAGWNRQAARSRTRPDCCDGYRIPPYTLYDKDEMSDLTAKERKALRAMLKTELEARRST
jgi:hypothetical protein